MCTRRRTLLGRTGSYIATCHFCNSVGTPRTAEQQCLHHLTMTSRASEEPNGGPSKRRRESDTPSGTSGKIRRAARACDRCRASKLRCQPDQMVQSSCAHCVKMRLDCVYTNSTGLVTASSGHTDRLDQLETSVSKILDLLQGASTTIQPTLATAAPWSNTTGDLDVPLFYDNSVDTLASALPHSSLSPVERYDSTHARPLPKVGSASRMAAFRESFAHEAPFRSLAYNPDTFRNAEVEGQSPRQWRNDPVDAGIFSEDKARQLFAFFCNEIVFLLPIFQEPISFDVIRKQSPFLLTSMLAVAAKYCTGDPSKSVTVDFEGWCQIRALAMSSYFEALISKVHCLEDIQATLMLGVWGLGDRGASPDPWIMSGSAYRLARRLGAHQIAASLASGAKPSTRLVSALKTYLCIYAFDRLFSCGFGRPETEVSDATVDTTYMLELLNPSSDTYCSIESAATVVAYVELAHIAHRYSRLVTIMKERPQIMGELNSIGDALDTFAGRWTRHKSSLSRYPGLAARPIRVLYDHLRLCVYSVVVKRGIGNASLKAESSAMAIIQTFHDELRDDNDAVLCYAYDYAFLVLAHAAASLLRFSSDEGRSDAPSPRANAMRYTGMALAALVEADKSANHFAHDVAGILSLIAKESGMALGEWVDGKVIASIEARADDSDKVLGPEAMEEPFASLDMFLQPGLFDDLGWFGGI